MQKESRYVALVSLDWADRSHKGCLQQVGSSEVEDFGLIQTAWAIEEWVGQLRERFKGGKIAVAIEQKRGPLIYALMKYELFVIFPLNTTAVKNYRKALRASGAKDDPSDAWIQLLFLRNHLDQLRCIEPDGVLTRKIRILVEFRRKLVDRSTALSNQITALLKEYYPTALDLVSELKTPLALDLLRKWPTLEAIKKVKPERLREFYYKRNCRSAEAVEARIRTIQQALPLIDEKPMITAYAQILRCLVEQMNLLLREIGKFDRKIENLFMKHPDLSFYKSLPGAGPALEPRLAVIFGEDRNKFDSAVAVSNLIGVSPVTIQSGKKKAVVFRLGAPKFARQSLVEFALHTINKSAWANAYYWKCKNEGKSHHAAVRALAYKWVRILYRCWKNRTPYDENIYLAALKKRNAAWFVNSKAS